MSLPIIVRIHVACYEQLLIALYSRFERLGVARRLSPDMAGDTAGRVSIYLDASYL